MDSDLQQRVLDALNGSTTAQSERIRSAREVFDWDRPVSQADRRSRMDALDRWDRMFVRLMASGTDKGERLTGQAGAFLFCLMATALAWVGLVPLTMMGQWMLCIPLAITLVASWGLLRYGRTLNQRAEALEEACLSRPMLSRVMSTAPDYVHACLHSAVPMFMKGDWAVLANRHDLPADPMSTFSEWRARGN